MTATTRRPSAGPAGSRRAQASATRGSHRASAVPGGRSVAARRVLRMSRFEMGMLIQQKVALLSLLLAPAMGIGMVAASRPTNATQWTVMLSSMSMLVLIFSVYNTVTSTVVSRREAQILKRLRTSELLPPQMLIAMAAPYILVGLVQVAILVVAYQLMGAPPVGNVPALIGVTLATTVMSVLAGLATASVTANVGGIVASILVLNPAMPSAARVAALLLPYASSSDLLARTLGVSSDSLSATAPVQALADAVNINSTSAAVVVDVALLVAWCVAFALFAHKTWRWEPRG